MGGEEGFKAKVVSEALGEFEARILPLLESTSDETKRFLLFIAWLNGFLESRGLGRIVITGGFAVEVYTGRVYRTMDVDVIADNCAEYVEGFLERFSEKIGRGYLPRYEVLVLKSIDVVSSAYKRRRNPVELSVNGYKVYLDPVEDLVAVYLSGWKYWGSTEDRDKALWLLATWLDKIDAEYLKATCEEKGVLDKLEELLNVVKTM